MDPAHPELQASPPAGETAVKKVSVACQQAHRILLNSAPLCPVAVGLMTGIVLSHRGVLGPASSLTLLSLSTVAGLSRRARHYAGLALVFVAACGSGGILHWSRAAVSSPNRIDRIAEPDGRIVRLRGRIGSPPRLIERAVGPFAPWQPAADQTAFLLNVQGAFHEPLWLSASGTIRVTVREAVLDLREGESVELFGRLFPLRPARNPGAFDWRDYYLRQGVTALLYCDHRENIVRTGPGTPAIVGRLRTKMRGLLTDDIAAAAPDESSLLEAMVLGHRSRFDRRLNEIFTRAGCIHFIAASGTNIVILMGAVWLVGRLAGLSRRECAWCMIAAICLYGAVAEARPPILRACIMGLLFCLALLLRRPGAHFNWICAAAVILCILDPLTVMDVGFQLSFAAVLGVAYLTPAMLRAVRSLYWWLRHVAMRDPYAFADTHLRFAALKYAPLPGGVRLRRYAAKGLSAAGLVFAVSAAAWLTGLPITAAQFQQVQPWGAISSMLVYPLISAIMLLGALKIALAAMSPTAAELLRVPISLLDAGLLTSVEALSRLPGSSTLIAPPPGWAIGGFYLSLLGFAYVFRRRPARPAEGANQPLPRLQPAAFGSAPRWGWWPILVLIAISATAWHAPATEPDQFTVTVLAVGSGSATVLELPGGQVHVYDAGGSGTFDVSAGVVAPYLRFRGIDRVDRIFVSHPNLDHFSGVPGLIQQVPSGPLVLNHCFDRLPVPPAPARRLLELVSAAHHPVERLEPALRTWEQEGVRFELLWPGESCLGLQANDTSTVLRVTFAGHSVLLTGDIEEAAQRRLLSTANLKADVLLLPHHGSVHGSTREFLRAVDADVLVRSSNERLEDTDNGLLDLKGNARLLNTADHGAIRIILDATGIRVEPWLDGP